MWWNSASIHDKNSQRIRYRGNISQHKRAIYDQPTAHIILNGEKSKACPLRSGKRQGTNLTTPTQYSPGNPSQSYWARKKKLKASKSEKKEVKLSLFADDMISYMKIRKDSKKLLEVINKFSTVEDTNTNVQNQLHFYTLKMNYPKNE